MLAIIIFFASGSLAIALLLHYIHGLHGKLKVYRDLADTSKRVQLTLLSQMKEELGDKEMRRILDATIEKVVTYEDSL